MNQRKNSDDQHIIKVEQKTEIRDAVKKLRAIKKEQIKINEQYDAAKKILEKYEKQLKDTKNNTEFERTKKDFTCIAMWLAVIWKRYKIFVTKIITKILMINKGSLSLIYG